MVAYRWFGLPRGVDHGQGDSEQVLKKAAGYATVGIIAKYRDEFEYYIAHGRSKYGGVLEVDAPQREVAHA